MIFSTNKSIAIFGDVHGDFNKLKKLLDTLDAQYPKIKIFSTGDLVDRGPNSKEVVELCIKRKVIAVKGNHDKIFEEVFSDETENSINSHLHPGMGGMATLESYSNGVLAKDKKLTSVLNRDQLKEHYKKCIPKKHQKYIKAMPLYIVLEIHKKDFSEIYLLNHGALSQQDFDEWCAENYDDFITSEPYEVIDKVTKEFENNILWVHKWRGWAKPYNIRQIMGHLPMENVIIGEDIITLDTGCGKGGKLSCLILPENKIIEII